MTGGMLNGLGTRGGCRNCRCKIMDFGWRRHEHDTLDSWRSTDNRR